ncbi:hypothetical protein D1007_33507 [Hordeum vulgare]|nr:hypothetical protein D1007_33507 [Hordeum vulgare]
MTTTPCRALCQERTKVLHPWLRTTMVPNRDSAPDVMSVEDRIQQLETPDLPQPHPIAPAPSSSHTSPTRVSKTHHPSLNTTPRHRSGQWDAFAEGTPMWDVDPVAGGLAVGLNGDMYYVPPGDALVDASGVMAEAPKTLGYILGEEIWSFLMGWDEQDPVADIISIPSSPALDLR